MRGLISAALAACACLAAGCAGWGLEYSRELHSATVGRRAEPREFAHPIENGVTGGSTPVHRFAITDRTGALMAGLSGGMSRYAERQKAIEEMIRNRESQGSYTYTMPGVAPGPRTVVSYYFGESDDAFGIGDGRRFDGDDAKTTMSVGCRS